MTSLWLDGRPTVADDFLPSEPVDDVVVGAGITGLTTALLLARAGRRVAVLEARTVGAVTSGNTTGKVSLLQGTKLSRMRSHQSASVLRAYVSGQREGQQWLLRFCTDHGVPFEVRDAVTYAEDGRHADALDRELAVCREVGLDVHLARDLDVPFPHVGGVVLADQAQLDVVTVLHALVHELRAHGGTVHQGVRVTGMSRRAVPTVRLEDGGSVHARTVVLATGAPVLDRGLYFAKLRPMRSYVSAHELVGDAPVGMYLSAGQDARSLRTAQDREGRELLLVGGAGHDVGRAESEQAHLEALRRWTERYFPGARETHTWSAQDYRSHDSFPYVGALPRGGGRTYVATGFDKWGIAGGVAAARSVSAQILGEPPSWQRPLSRRITRPSGVLEVVRTNVDVAAAAVLRGTKALVHRSETPAPGGGDVGRRGATVVAVSDVDGRSCAVSAFCTHLGGVLSWNDAERTWDCPLHGSRFAPDGRVLEGPAVSPLPPR